jgi:hypothetical protein
MSYALRQQQKRGTPVGAFEALPAPGARWGEWRREGAAGSAACKEVSSLLGHSILVSRGSPVPAPVFGSLKMWLEPSGPCDGLV